MYYAVRMQLLADLDAFYLEHRRCGELEAEAEKKDSGWVIMACTCGAQIVRRILSDRS